MPMDTEQPHHPIPSRRDVLASLDVQVFLDLWTLTTRCACGRERVAPLPGAAARLPGVWAAPDQRHHQTPAVRRAGGDADLIR